MEKVLVQAQIDNLDDLLSVRDGTDDATVSEYQNICLTGAFCALV